MGSDWLTTEKCMNPGKSYFGKKCKRYAAISENSSLLLLKCCHWRSSIRVINYRSNVQKDQIFNELPNLSFWCLTLGGTVRSVRQLLQVATPPWLGARRLNMAIVALAHPHETPLNFWRQSLQVLHILQKEHFHVPPEWNVRTFTLICRLIEYSTTKIKVWGWNITWICFCAQTWKCGQIG